jgi:RHS repeat-associated protein
VGGLLSVKDGASVYHYTYDANGNVSEVLSNSGSIAAHYEYTPFGATLVASGTYAPLNEYRFSTKPLDGASGLYCYGLRYYNPNSGRWPSRDPIYEVRGKMPEFLPEGPNLYAYVGNKVIDSYDPDGLGVPLVIGGVVVTVGAVEAAAAAAGIGMLACLASPDCRAAAAELARQATARALCEAKYTADVAVCAAIGCYDKRAAAICYAEAMNAKVRCLEDAGL